MRDLPGGEPPIDAPPAEVPRLTRPRHVGHDHVLERVEAALGPRIDTGKARDDAFGQELDHRADVGVLGMGEVLLRRLGGDACRAQPLERVGDLSLQPDVVDRRVVARVSALGRWSDRERHRGHHRFVGQCARTLEIAANATRDTRHEDVVDRDAERFVHLANVGERERLAGEPSAPRQPALERARRR